jgi:hypothetical protein
MPRIISGVLVGDRIINFAGQYIIKDFQNKIESTITFPFKVYSLGFIF